jgi:8-oxo-dGTP pyrophosphatase MutT (NUDIX family)
LAASWTTTSGTHEENNAGPRRAANPLRLPAPHQAARRGTPAYWVFPGGGVEETDQCFEDALVREVAQELGGSAAIDKLICVLERNLGPDTVEQERYLLAVVDRWSTRDRTGPEFGRAGSGLYEYDDGPQTRAEIQARDIRPTAVRNFLLEHCERLEDLPDLR